MKKILLISSIIIALLSSARSQTWIGVSHFDGLESVTIDYFYPNATITENGLFVERQLSKHWGVGFGINRLRYNFESDNTNLMFSRYPIYLKYYSRFLNIEPTVFASFYQGKSMDQSSTMTFNDFSLVNLGFGVSLSKDFPLSKRFLLEPEIMYMSRNISIFYPELYFGIQLKYCLK